MLVKMYINAHYICAMCRNSKSVAKKVAIFINKKPCNILLKQVGYNGIIKIIRYEKSDIDDTRKQQ